MLVIRFLVVDDDEMLLRALLPHVEALSGVAGVDAASTPRDALATLAALPPGRVVVLSDFNLKSDRTGVQLLQEVAQLRPDALRVLMSGYDESQLGLCPSEDALHAFIEKPLHLREMVPRLQRLIAKHWA